MSDPWNSGGYSSGSSYDYDSASFDLGAALEDNISRDSSGNKANRGNAGGSSIANSKKNRGRGSIPIPLSGAPPSLSEWSLSSLSSRRNKQRGRRGSAAAAASAGTGAGASAGDEGSPGALGRTLIHTGDGVAVIVPKEGGEGL